MDKQFNIVFDTLGSDKGPNEILLGIKNILNNHFNVSAIIVGDEELIKTFSLPSERVKIIDSKQTVSNFDNPVEAFYKQKNVSIFKAIEEVANNDTIGMITAGNSGALLVGVIRYLLINKSTRPCMAAILPTTKNDFTALVDTGATIDCSPTQLVSFAHAGSIFMKQLFKIESPRVGLLSNGVEPTKGNKLVKETYSLLKEDANINFVGNIEGNKALNGDCDVLVCDGFAGNQVLKNSEGMAMNLIKEIIKFGKMNDMEEVTMKIVSNLMKTFDFENLGAGIVLGAKVPVMKCRGSSGSKAIESAAKYLINIAENKSLYEGVDERK